MTTQHVAVGLVAGDDWELSILLLDENNNPYDLTQATILWCLMDSQYVRVINTEDVILTIPDPLTGVCLVHVPNAATTTLPAGFYTDTLRIVIGGIVTTLLFGQINVMADPWGVVAVQTTERKIVPFQRTLVAEHDKQSRPA